MNAFLLWVACFVLAVIAIGFLRIFRGPAKADRMMAAQLAGTGSAAILLLLAIATATPAIVDAALMIALLAAFASVAFVRSASGEAAREETEGI